MQKPSERLRAKTTQRQLERVAALLVGLALRGRGLSGA